MKVAQLMSRDVVSCRPDESLAVAAKRMWDQACGALPVVNEHSRVLGMITDRDIYMAAYTQGRPLEQIAVSIPMSRRALTCRASDSIGEAESVMREARVRRLPVVDEGGRIVGILSLDDVARGALGDEADLVDAGLTLAAIGEPRIERLRRMFAR